MKGSSLTLHPEQEQLLRYLDGELLAQDSAAVRSHLEACWQCRAALTELQDVVSECVQYRKNVLQRHLPTPPAPWIDIYRQFDEIDAAEPGFFDRVVRLLRIPVSAAMRTWVPAALALLLLFGLFYRYRQAPSVHAAELLRKAVVAAKAHPAQPRRIQIRTRNSRFTRPAVAVQAVANADAEALQSVQSMFLRANYDWTDPLSAQSFEAWRNQLSGKSDRVTEENQTYRIETRTDASELRQSILTLRAADLHPLEQRFEFSNQEWVEITELAEEAPPVAAATSVEGRSPTLRPTAPAGETPQEPPAPFPSATAADELQVVAALHNVGADLGDPLEISRSGSDVVVNGVGIAPPRQHEIKDAIGSRAHVVVRFSDSPAATGQSSPSAAPDNASSADARMLQARLAEQLGGRANLDQFSAQVLESSESLMARAYALRRLAEQFPSSAERELSAPDRQLLQRLRTEHSAALRQQAIQIGSMLDPLFSHLSGDSGMPPDRNVPSLPWQAVTEDLFQSARRTDKLVGVMFGAAPSDSPWDQIPAQLKTTLAELRVRLDIYERSNK